MVNTILNVSHFVGFYCLYIYIWTIFFVTLPVFQYFKKSIILWQILSGLLFSFYIMLQKLINVAVFIDRLFSWLYTNSLCTWIIQVSCQSTLGAPKHPAFLFLLKYFLPFLRNHDMTIMLKLTDKNIYKAILNMF